jgi:AcrR family transcriptional regulator
MANSGALSAKQSKAIAALLSSKTVLGAAELAGVSARTLTRWLADDDFKAALTEAESEAIDAATRRLIGLQSEAVDCLHDTLTDRKALPGIRMRAAQSILDFLMRLRELRNVEKRLAALEKIINEHK